MLVKLFFVTILSISETEYILQKFISSCRYIFKISFGKSVIHANAFDRPHISEFHRTKTRVIGGWRQSSAHTRIHVELLIIFILARESKSSKSLQHFSAQKSCSIF